MIKRQKSELIARNGRSEMNTERDRKHRRDDGRRIAAEAAHWFTVMGDDTDVARNLDAFSKWLDADDRHLVAFTRLCETAPLADGARARSPLTRLAQSLGLHHLRWAVPVLALGLVVVFAAMPKGLETPVGAWQDQVKDDGSLLRFGPGSRAEVAFSGERRLVSLEAGSVIVEAAKDPNRPLIVETPHGAVRVVGTRFTVIVDPSSTELTVSRGEVQATAAMAPGTPVSVRSSQRVRISSQTVTRDPAPALDAEESYLGWRTLNRAPVTDLITAIERESGKHVIILPTPATRKARASGRFHVRDAEATLSVLVDAYGLHRADGPLGVTIVY